MREFYKNTHKMNQYFFKNWSKSIVYLFFVVLVISIPVGNVAVRQLFISNIEHGNKDKFLFCIFLFFIYVVISCILCVLHQRAKKKYLIKTMTDINQDLLSGILNSGFSELLSKDTGYYLSLFSNDIRMIEEKYIRIVFLMIGSIFQLIICLLYAAIFDFRIGLIMLMISLVSLKFPKLLSKNLSNLQNKNMDQQSQHISFLKNIMGGFDVIYNFLAKSEIKSEYAKVNEKTQDIYYFADYKTSLINFFSSMLNIVYVLIILSICGYSVLMGRMDIATMIALSELADNIFYPLVEIINDLNYIKSTRKIREKVMTFIDKPEKEQKGNRKIKNFTVVEFKDVYFKYKGQEKDTLKSINCKFEFGKKYAIVGDSGSGKSTLLKLILGYYNVNSGSCSIDGMNIHDISPQLLHEFVSIIPQKVYMFQTTLKNNITLYKEYDYMKLEQCIMNSGLFELVQKLPQGMETILYEDGENLSGGEQQRIAIARAYLRESPLLLLDEAFSALDNKTAYEIESEILQNINITCISVTHRLQEEILKKYDEILVLKKGSIVERGTFDDLNNNSCEFRALFNMYVSKK